MMRAEGFRWDNDQRDGVEGTYLRTTGDVGKIGRTCGFSVGDESERLLRD